ncbi:hypothetical protein BKA82DRAFT_1003482 [Pisolithus tinctorius]|uniref:Rap1 Myb domain-containing protein n=1 Tax=Pisolithus tinctorius Marx 270 TaxID=870435 RepID=A0A0C3NZQ6_PISTI|nr:hypothetical protein BKA82DRAFT_1003482 [Pisolithus tinctorius]KIO00776.1 hypothetical protein M404DRAFT_1003482 [Pisolithus tinctorius Marx 270]
MTRSAASAERDGGEGIFLKDGKPVRFYFHESAKEGVNGITEDIVTNGGLVVKDDRNADVVLVDEEADVDIIRRRYYSSEEPHRRRIFVERRGFVRRCVRNGIYEHYNPHRREGMPGPRPLMNGGRVRVDFTREDDKHLAFYLATIFPVEEAGGRLGNVHYKELVQLAQYPDYSWAARHTWHSWRERYKKNRAYFDPMIAKAADSLQDGHGHGHEHRSRMYRIRGKLLNLEGEDEEEEASAGENAAGAARECLRQNEDELIAFQAEEEDPPGGKTMVGARVRLPGKHGRSGSDAHNYEMVSPRKRVRVSLPTSSKSQTSRTSDIERGHRHGGQENVLDIDRDSSRSLQSEEDLFGGYDTPDTPAPHSPVLNGIEATPELTQRTLVGSPHGTARRKEQDISRTSGPGQEPPPTSQVTLVAAQEITIEEKRWPEDVNDIAQARHIQEVANDDARSWSAASRPRRRGAIPEPPLDAPARNTRARSKSAEPQLVVRTAGGSKSRRKGRRKELEFVPEDQEALPTFARGQTFSAKDIFEDERIVEGLLEGEASSILSSSIEESPPLPPFQDIKLGGDELLDPDDAETHDNLQQSSRPSHPPEENDDDAKFSQSSDDSMLKVQEHDAEIEEKMERLRRARLTLPIQNTPSDARRQPRGRSVNSFPTPATPRRGEHSQKVRFPSPGTEAREVIDRRNREKRKQPYIPPTGSRAAALLQG